MKLPHFDHPTLAGEILRTFLCQIEPNRKQCRKEMSTINEYVTFYTS